MSSAFQLEVAGDRLATLTFDLPDSRVNIFNQSVMDELDQLIQKLARRTDIGCLVLLSGKREIFIAGADVQGIASVTDSTEAEHASREGQRIFRAWEQLPFPTIAAVQGTCVGGGTEISLASDYILISDRPELRIGLPETKLGILPGWGGCTRLPERIGIAAALDIILAGKAIPSKKAFKIGLADALLPDASFLHQVRDFAVAHLDRQQSKRHKGGLKDALLEKNPLGRKLLFDQARKQTIKLTKGHYPASLRAIEVVRVGVEQGREAGFAAEARAIGELAVSPICKNLIHLFNLMEAAKRSTEDFQPREITGVGVLGAGTMGGGIAQLVAAKVNLPVRLKDLALEPLAKGIAHAAELFGKQVKRRRLAKPAAKEKIALIRPTTTYDGFERCDLVVEAIVENLGVKQKVFAELAQQVSDDTILASNTSSLDVDLIGQDTAHPGRVVGMHFFNPVHKMPLVEVVVGNNTGQRATDTIVDFSRKLGKTPIVVKSTAGFLVNRLLGFYMNGAFWLLDEGVSVEDLDRAMTGWGMPMGPMRLTDEVGLDVGLKVAHILAEAFPGRLPLPAWGDQLSSDPKRLGVKTGLGVYTYNGKKQKGVDEQIYSLLGLGQPTSQIEPARLVERMVLPMVDEAARCLAEGVVGGPGELDLAMIMGTGFPPFRGGLCRWADEQGLESLISVLEKLADTVGERYRPSRPLQEAAAAGGFYRHWDS